MNVEYLSDKVERLQSVISNILYLKPEDRLINPHINNLEDLIVILNEIFDENKCTGVTYTLNTDKPFFGIRVFPAMNGNDALTILTTEEKVKLVNYEIEFDSKLFDIGLDSSELAAVVLFEIASMMDNNQIFDVLRSHVDTYLITNDDVINIRNSANYSQLITFGIKDSLYKFSSVIFKNDAEELLIPIIQAINMEDYIISAKEKILASASGISDSMRTPNPEVLDWVLFVYKDIKRNKGIIYDTLTDAKAFTASRIEIREINACIEALNRIDTTISFTESINKYLEKKNFSAINEVSIFKSLKKNGLRSLENELYEYSMRVKNCTDADDAYLIMRGINNRLGILEDYMYNEDLSINDRKHWEMVADSYRQLRVILSKKKFDDKQYGLFFDYSALDKLDRKPEE